MQKQNHGNRCEYIVHYAGFPPKNNGDWDDPAWKNTPHLEVNCFRPESSEHRPTTKAKLLYNLKELKCLFHVQDQYVRCIHTECQDPVYQDSCVEFFVQPKPDYGYFNFEFNCGGTLLASYITDPTRVGTDLREYTPLIRKEVEQINIYHSLPRKVFPEIQRKVNWQIEFSIPFSLFEKYIGPLPDIQGKTWRANFYKCGDHTSHPHWASWSPVTELNFHLPECFGNIYFQTISRPENADNEPDTSITDFSSQPVNGKPANLKN
jgi:hypothetical protein